MIAHSAYLLVLLLAFADEPKSAALLETLSEDGVWVTYNGTIKINGQETVVSWTARSVGKALGASKECRFIELEQASDSTRAELGNVVWRLLVPEDAFGEGRDPLKNAVKTWVKYGTNEPEVVENIDTKDPLFAMLCRGPKQNLKAESAKEKISWQMGDLECPVIVGKNEIELGAAKIEMIHRVFRHKEVPFGLAGTSQDVKVSFGGQQQTANIRMTLQNHGKDAKAKLPELQP